MWNVARSNLIFGVPTLNLCQMYRYLPQVNYCCRLNPAKRARTAETECTPAEAVSCEVEETCAAGAVGYTCAVVAGKRLFAE